MKFFTKVIDMKYLIRCSNADDLKDILPVSKMHPNYVYGSKFFHMTDWDEGQDIRLLVKEKYDGSWVKTIVNISDLWSDQEVNRVSHILSLAEEYPTIADVKALCRRDPIRVVEHEGNMFLLDGNTRCILLSIYGETKVEVMQLLI